jgi:hypothetical protein
MSPCVCSLGTCTILLSFSKFIFGNGRVIYKVNNSGNCTMAQNSLKLHAPSHMYYLGVQEFVVDLKHILIYANCCTE